MHLGKLSGFMGAGGGGCSGFSQQHVPDFSAFGGVDFFTSEHGITVGTDTGLADQLEQQGLGGGVNEVFG